jgi:outer membrane lipoprotein-sorting protein
MLSSRIYLISSIFPLALLFPSCLFAWNSTPTDTLLKKMEGAYAGVNDYQANIEIRTYGKDGSFQTRKFLYTFKKPGKIRLDFEARYAGMIVVYPDQEGRVILRRFFTFHLAPDNPFLRDRSGQRIDQTDMGLLIEKIAQSLTDHRRGALEMTEDEQEIRIRSIMAGRMVLR